MMTVFFDRKSLEEIFEAIHDLAFEKNTCSMPVSTACGHFLNLAKKGGGRNFFLCNIDPAYGNKAIDAAVFTNRHGSVVFDSFGERHTYYADLKKTVEEYGHIGVHFFGSNPKKALPENILKKVIKNLRWQIKYKINLDRNAKRCLERKLSFLV